MSNETDRNLPIYGWVNPPEERGSIDILWSCSVTIILCCWVSVYPNVGSATDKWYHPVIDKFNLFCIGLLGPDFLFGIAFGQYFSARRGLNLFKKDLRHSQGRDNFEWTYAHAFFVDMGGIHLTSPDFPQGFPINAEQFHYLAVHNHIDVPDFNDFDIQERNSADTLSRLITAFQAFWFFVRAIVRFATGLPTTTLELTTLSFSLVMIATSAFWYHKPSITQPRCIPTKDGRTVEEIRVSIQCTTHPNLPATWYRTPLESLTLETFPFRINTHWAYYTQLATRVHIRFLIGRPVTSRPWDRFPSDTWLRPDFAYIPFLVAAAVQLVFSGCFVFAWNWYFPTHAEKLLWRVASVYHMVFSIYGGLYFLREVLSWKGKTKPDTGSIRVTEHVQGSRSSGLLLGESSTESSDYHQLQQVHLGDLPDDADLTATDTVTTTNAPLRDQHPHRQPGLHRHQAENGHSRLSKWRNISPDNDPEMTMSLRILVPTSVLCFLYVLARGYFYIEDLISLRVQPAGVYTGTDRFFPFLV